jgi:NAD(P)-dependent dehydrogenase (short-subunit alcohol dehydrogenase family)
VNQFSGVRALVTGGASGIGRGLATALLEEGAAHVVLADIEPVALDEAVAALNALGFGAASGIVCDVTDSASVDAAAEDA